MMFSNYGERTMNKHEKKLIKYQDKAQHCLTREDALKILRKHTEARAKLYVKRIIEDE